MPRVIKASRLSLEGPEGSMKTSTAYTAPYPTVGFAFDLGFDRALYGKKAEYWAGLDIYIHEFDLKVEADKGLWRGHDITIFKLPKPLNMSGPNELIGFTQLWNYFNSRFARVIQDAEYVRSTIVDTGTLAREIKADAHLQELQELGRRQNPPRIRERLQEYEYRPANDAIQNIYVQCEAVGINLVVTHHLTDERQDTPVADARGNVTVERRKTGRQILHGYSRTYQYVDTALRMAALVDPATKDISAQAHSSATFMKSGYNQDLLNQTLKDVTWNKLMRYIEISLGGNIILPKSQIDSKE